MKHQLGFRVTGTGTAKLRMTLGGVMLAAALSANAQVVASHAPTLASAPTANNAAPVAPAAPAATSSVATPAITAGHSRWPK